LTTKEGTFLTPIHVIHWLKSCREIQLELEQLDRELEDLKKLKREKDQTIATLGNGLRSFEERKRQLRIQRQRLDDRIEKISNDIEENVADSRLGILETQLEVGIVHQSGYTVFNITLDSQKGARVR